MAGECVWAAGSGADGAGSGYAEYGYGEEFYMVSSSSSVGSSASDGSVYAVVVEDVDLVSLSVDSVVESSLRVAVGDAGCSGSSCED